MWSCNDHMIESWQPIMYTIEMCLTQNLHIYFITKSTYRLMNIIRCTPTWTNSRQIAATWAGEILYRILISFRLVVPTMKYVCRNYEHVWILHHNGCYSFVYNCIMDTVLESFVASKWYHLNLQHLFALSASHSLSMYIAMYI